MLLQRVLTLSGGLSAILLRLVFCLNLMAYRVVCCPGKLYARAFWINWRACALADAVAGGFCSDYVHYVLDGIVPARGPC